VRNIFLCKLFQTKQKGSVHYFVSTSKKRRNKNKEILGESGERKNKKKQHNALTKYRKLRKTSF